MSRIVLSAHLTLLTVGFIGCGHSTPAKFEPLSAAPASGPVPTLALAPPDNAAAASEFPAAHAAASAEAALSTFAPAAPPLEPVTLGQERTVAKPVVQIYSRLVPAVQMSSGECADCAVAVGDAMPAIELPVVGGHRTALAELRGEQATVILFWTADRWMSETALGDLERDVARPLAKRGVRVVGVAVGAAAAQAPVAIKKSGASYPQLLDAEAQAAGRVGGVERPRVYVLDEAGKIAWFDIEYSETTRREMLRTLAVLTTPAR